MKNLESYINRVGRKTFLDAPFNEVDNVIFSLLIYVPFNGIIPNSNSSKITIKHLNDACKNVVCYKQKKEATITKNARKILQQVANSKRYKDLKLYNYVYSVDKFHQFGACTIELPDNKICVVFKGTDDFVSGWEEDFRMFYEYPVKAQKLAINYLKRTVKFFGPDVIIVGHSKGGNLAIVSSMNLNVLKRKKVLKIYSNDGLGLTDELFNSKKYKNIKEKVINFIPTSSLVGVMLKKGDYFTVTSSSFSLLQHNPYTWNVTGEHLERGKQNNTSKQMEKIIASWLSKHNEEEKRELVNGIFSIFKEAKIESFIDLKETKITGFIKIINASRKLDLKTKETIKQGILLLMEEIKNNKKEKITN